MQNKHTVNDPHNYHTFLSHKHRDKHVHSHHTNASNQSSISSGQAFRTLLLEQRLEKEREERERMEKKLEEELDKIKVAVA